MVNMRAGLPRLGTVCDEYGLGGMEHILMMAGTAHELRMVTCPALGTMGCSILRTGIAAGAMAGKVRGETITGRIRIHHYPAQATAKALQSASHASRLDWLAIGCTGSPGYALSLTGGD
jgi:hypothetical protein